MRLKERTSKHYLVRLTQPDESDHIAYPSTDFKDARLEIRQLAAEKWYRIGLTGVRKVPPQRYAYAYRLGRLTAMLGNSV